MHTSKNLANYYMHKSDGTKSYQSSSNANINHNANANLNPAVKLGNC